MDRLCFRCGKPTPPNEWVSYHGHEDCAIHTGTTGETFGNILTATRELIQKHKRETRSRVEPEEDET